jgi:hypothetical protein
VAAYSSVSDIAGGHFFRFGAGTLSDTTVGGAFNNFDGLGRKVRFRYDTRSFEAIQRLRAKAQENGYLVDNEAQAIVEEGGVRER